MGGKYFSLVLHSHIPYVVGHGTWPHGMDWLYEAAAERGIAALKHKDLARNERLTGQFIREKFLLESSDWPFLISTGAAADYAKKRALEHAEKADTLLA